MPHIATEYELHRSKADQQREIDELKELIKTLQIRVAEGDRSAEMLKTSVAELNRKEYIFEVTKNRDRVAK